MSTKHSPSVQAPLDEAPTFIEAARRAQIIGCAIDAIAEVGYARASLAEIARRARVSKSVISYYFASKEELIGQVVESVYTSGAAFMLPLLEAQVPNGARALLRTYIESNIAFMDANRNHVLALVNIVSGWGSDGVSSRFAPRLYARDGTRVNADSQEPVLSDLEQILLAGQKSGEFRPFSPRVMAVTLRAAIDALPTRLAVYPGLDLQECARELVALFDAATRNATAPGRHR